MNVLKELTGNWEERGVIGTRIEINKNRITVLWRSAPVLETKFTVTNEDGATVLHPEKTGMRYPHENRDYATVTGLVYKDGKLTFNEYFPITGDSTTVLTKTENSRFGNYTIEDEKILPLIRGEWTSDDGFYSLSFKGDRLRINGEEYKIHILKSRSGYGDEYKIADADPSKDGLHHFSGVTLCGGRITAVIPVMDAPNPWKIIFTKKN